MWWIVDSIPNSHQYLKEVIWTRCMVVVVMVVCIMGGLS